MLSAASPSVPTSTSRIGSASPIAGRLDAEVPSDMVGRAKPRLRPLNGACGAADSRPGGWMIRTPIAPFFRAGSIFANGLKIGAGLGPPPVGRSPPASGCPA